ncbi:hypothetical protein Q9L42_010195 [Methylomarinum sp. Ch1-1]|uniref:Uncharacterized protein n=1 Tax=Methylomarinum roseum TaxID=3067653 RepID=A0AAU7NZU3_9GAMM|nr:hypothetical protein [Methylomarinum sp. Ch1-1]MDP4521382.1 hypothetical protein [Methylomarinum sp. Ch1-1]
MTTTLLKRRLNILLLTALLSLFYWQTARAHLGPHESSDCFINIETTQLRFNGYQFHGQHPEKHYCRYFPQLGDVIIQIDSLQDLGPQQISLQWLELASLPQLFSEDKALVESQPSPWKPFADGINSLRKNVQQLGLYGIKIRLKAPNGVVRQQHFYFLVGFPVMPILLGVALLLLLLIGLIFLRQSKRSDR